MNDKNTDMECGAVWLRNMDLEEIGYKKLEALKYGFGEEWRKSAGQNMRQMEKHLETIGDVRTIKTRSKKWIGHTFRGESLLKR